MVFDSGVELDECNDVGESKRLWDAEATPSLGVVVDELA